jgi:exopolysaccharide production protein ExoQ
MKLRVSTFVTPGKNSVYATAALTLTFLAMVHTLVLGPIPILVMYAFWLPLWVIGYRTILRNPWPLLLIVMLPGYAILSTFWSDYPSVTLRAGIQYLSLILCAIAIGRTCRTIDVTRSVVMASIVTLVLSILFGENTYDPIEQEYNYAGLLGSKNQVGMVASFAILLSYAGWVFLKDRTVFGVVYLAGVATGAVALVLSKSATSVVTIAGAIGAILVLRTLSRFPAAYRRSAVLLGALALPVILFAAVAGDLAGIVLDAFGKDVTLTGRTYLWSEAIRLSADDRMFGRGYQAFWVQGQLDAERLWFEFYIESRGGFHFHNLYVETLVGLGVVGLAMMITFLVWHVMLAMFVMMDGATRSVGSTIFAVFLLLLARSFSEVDFLGPFGIGALLMFAFSTMLSSPETARQAGRLWVSEDFPSSEATVRG